MNGLPCQYAIIRFLPYAETGEFANVGVALACPATGYLDARLMPPRKTGRITGFFEQLDVRIYREAMKFVGEELVRIRDVAEGQEGAPLVRQLFEGLTRPREGLLRFGDTRVILTDDPEIELNRLFARFVERDFASKQYHDQVLERGVRETLRRANLRDYFRKAEIGNDDLHIQVPFAHLREGAPILAIKPIDLAKVEPNQIYDVGGHWADKIRRLGRHKLLPSEMLVAVRRPDPQEHKLRAAAEEILTDLRHAGVEVAEVDDVATITRFARAAVALPLH